MSWRSAFAGVMLLAGCAAAPVTLDRPERASSLMPAELPAMARFEGPPLAPVTRGNNAIARDFLDLHFRLESGRALPAFTRFEGPVTVRLTGPAAPALERDLSDLLDRLRSEAAIPISRSAAGPANITVETVTAAQIRAELPDAACFVAPNVSDFAEYRAARGSGRMDWAAPGPRRRVAIFLPADASPQEMRDCLQEELAQALGPLNDLYRLHDSIFNDDNIHAVLTGFDMLILRAAYDPTLRSGMSRAEVAARLPGILARLNPNGERLRSPLLRETPEAWKEALQGALGARGRLTTRRRAAARALEVARAEGWQDPRLGFSLYVLGRYQLGSDPGTALGLLLEAGEVFARTPGTALHRAHVAAQLAAFTLRAGDGQATLELVNAALPAAREHQNASLYATLLMLRAEALEMAGRDHDARLVRLDSIAWARYGFGPAATVGERLAEIAALSPE